MSKTLLRNLATHTSPYPALRQREEVQAQEPGAGWRSDKQPTPGQAFFFSRSSEQSRIWCTRRCAQGNAGARTTTQRHLVSSHDGCRHDRRGWIEESRPEVSGATAVRVRFVESPTAGGAVVVVRMQLRGGGRSVRIVSRARQGAGAAAAEGSGLVRDFHSSPDIPRWALRLNKLCREDVRHWRERVGLVVGVVVLSMRERGWGEWGEWGREELLCAPFSGLRNLERE